MIAVTGASWGLSPPAGVRAPAGTYTVLGMDAEPGIYLQTSLTSSGPRGRPRQHGLPRVHVSPRGEPASGALSAEWACCQPRLRALGPCGTEPRD